MPQDVLFFTAADKRYEHFVPVYACAILHAVEGSRVECALEDSAGYMAENAEQVAVIRKHFGDRFILRDADFSRAIPNTIRFITEPETKAEYLYIGDIDIVTLEPDMVEQHLRFMSRTGLPYSNCERKEPNRGRLTGLHFTRYDAFWPIPDISDIDLKQQNDEVVLLQIVKRRGLGMQDEEWFRPVHGIHMSPNREPAPQPGKMHWGMHLQYAPAFWDLMRSEAMRELRPHLAANMERNLAIIEDYYRANGAPD